MRGVISSSCSVTNIGIKSGISVVIQILSGHFPKASQYVSLQTKPSSLYQNKCSSLITRL